MEKPIQSTRIYVLSFFVLLFNGFNLLGQEPGNALDFDGIDDYVQIGTYWQGGQDCGYSGCKDGDLFLYLNSFTLEVWIKPTDVDGVTNQYEGVVGNGNISSQLAYSILINRSGFVSYKWFDQNTSTTKEIKTAAGSITNNRWQHIAILKSGTTLKIYINGVQYPTTGDIFNEGYQYSGKVVLLGGAPYMSLPFKGQIDELHIWKSLAPLPSLYNVVGGGGNLWCNLRFNYSGGNSISSISSTSNYYPSNGMMYNMDPNTDWVESYAMVVPKITGPTNNVNGNFTANWTAPEVGTVEKYYLEIATDSAMTSKVPAYSPYVDVGNVLSYSLTGLVQGQTYYYRLRAYKSSLGDVGAYTPTSRITMNVQEPGNALDFDGINDYVQIGTSWQGQRVWNATTSSWFYGDLYFYNMPFTIEAWVKPSDVDGTTNQYESITANGNVSSQLQYSLLINRAGFASFKWYDQNTGTTKEIRTAPGTITNNRWQHIAIGKPASNTLLIFINGVQQTTSGNPLTEGTIEGGLVMVGNAPNLSIPFKGQIDELHFWKNQFRTPTLYNVVGADSYLFCNMRFNNLEGNIISSISSVYNYFPSNGVMYNMDGNADRVESYAMVLPHISGPTNVGCGKFTANWTAPVTGTVEKYYLEIATDPGMTNKIPAYSPYVDVGNVLSYTLTGLNLPQVYYYRLRAFKSSVGDVGAYTPVASVTIADAVNPVVITQNITVSLDETGNVSITPEQIDNGSTDNCTIQSITLDKTSFNCSDIGVNTVVLTVTDASGNFSTGTATVTIPDNLIPVIGLVTQPTLLLPSGSVVLNNLPATGSWTITQSPGGITTDGTGTSTIISGLTTGTYTFTVTNSSGCTSGQSNNVVIDPQPVVVTADPGQSKIYNEADPALTYTFTPALLNGDSFTGNLDRAAGEIPGSYALNLGTLSAGPNYTISFIPENFTINPKPLTITGVTASNKVYDGTTSASLSGGTLSGVVSGDDVTLTAGTGVFEDKNSGVGIAIICSGYTLSGSDAEKYTVAQPEGVTADITKADPVISWNNPASITYGTALSATQLNATADIPGTFTYTPVSGTILNAGAGQILKADFAPNDAVNYNPVNNQQVQITVNKANQTITFNALAVKTCGDNSFDLSSSSSSGLTVYYTSSDPSVASVSGNTVTIFKAGNATITALQPGNTNYNEATNVDRTLVINDLDNSVTVAGNLLTANANGVSYQWVDCNNGKAPIQFETSKTFSPLTNGNYAVIISNNGCSVTSDCYNIITTGVNETFREGNIRAYPNPTSGNLTIDLAETFTKVEVIIADVKGKVSLRESFYDTRKIDLDIDGPTGLYFITIICNNGQRTILKVIKG
jgi:hypothetical protein